MSPIEIQVYFHKATVSGLYPHISTDAQKHFSTLVDFGDNPINGTAAIMVDIPVKDYTENQFISTVTKAAEEAIGRQLKNRDTAWELQEERDKLALFTKELAHKLGLKPGKLR